MSSSFEQITTTLKAIQNVGVQAIALLPNNDAGHSRIIEEIKKSGIQWYPSLTAVKFINLYRNTWALVGNSSSGIHETPTLKIPAVNIGNRQLDRQQAGNVIDVPHDLSAIENAIRKALFDETFRAFVSTIENPYGNGDSAEKIIKILKSISLKGIIQKRFYE